MPKVFTLARDPKDEPYIDLAAAAQARYLVSRDNDLLDLMGDAAFRRQFPGLTVIDPVALLRELASATEAGARPEDGRGRRAGRETRAGEGCGVRLSDNHCGGQSL